MWVHLNNLRILINTKNHLIHLEPYTHKHGKMYSLRSNNGKCQMFLFYHKHFTNLVGRFPIILRILNDFRKKNPLIRLEHYTHTHSKVYNLQMCGEKFTQEWKWNRCRLQYIQSWTISLENFWFWKTVIVHQIRMKLYLANVTVIIHNTSVNYINATPIYNMWNYWRIVIIID